MRILCAVIAAGLVLGCKTETIRVPGPVEYRDRLVVQPIPSQLLEEQKVATGKLSECPDVAAARKRSLEQCNAQLRAIKDGQDEPGR